MDLSALSRRLFIVRSLKGAAGLGLGFARASTFTAALAWAGGADDFGELGAPDANGLRLPPGFHSRIVARSGQAVGATGHVWHANPDGGASFATGDGGWLYVSNAESTTTDFGTRDASLSGVASRSSLGLPIV